jgi:DNA processing protein
MTARPADTACDDCLRRTDLIAALAGWLDVEWRKREAPARVLALSDARLLDACALPQARRSYDGFDPAAAREAIRRAGVTAVCRCEDAYPARLRDLADPPAVLHIAGASECLGLEDAVAVVGARRATHYGLTIAHDLGRCLSAAGVSVVSGLALGVDSSAHTGALAGGAAPPIAVLAGGCARPYPASKRQLYLAVRAAGAVVSELPPYFGIHRWAFVARNRLIAALAHVVVVVEATERSGSLTTADLGAELGRTVAAVPGRITCATAAGTNGVIRDGAVLVRHVHDVLDALAELTGARYQTRGAGPALEPGLQRLLDEIGAGHSTLAMLVGRGIDARAVLSGLGELETRGLVRRGFGGRYERVP